MTYPATLKVTVELKSGEVEFRESSHRVLRDVFVQQTLHLSCKFYRVFWVNSAGAKISILNIEDLRNYLLAADKQNQQAHIFVKRESTWRKLKKSIARKMKIEYKSN